MNVIFRLSILWRAALARYDAGSFEMISATVTSTMIADADEGLRGMIQACHALLLQHKNMSFDAGSDELNPPWWTELANISAMRPDDIPPRQTIQSVFIPPLTSQSISSQPISTHS
ncbi:hypothetical protein P4S72_23585 [Vibrio sp. PP-XX7]